MHIIQFNSINTMKTTIPALACAALALASCTQSSKSGYTVEGSIEGLAGKIYLTTFDGQQTQRIDSTEAENGNFIFTGTNDAPLLAIIETDNGRLARFFLENSPISITGTTAAPEAIEIKGSATQDLYTTYTDKQNAVMEAFSDTTLIQREEAVDSIFGVLNDQARQFVRENPGSTAAAFVLLSDLSGEMPFEELYASLEGFDSTVRNSAYALTVRKLADTKKRTAIGQPFTEITLPDPEGKEISLSSVAGKGKYVLLDFWASWCGPCRAEMPTLVEAYKKFSPKGFEIYAVSLDNNKENWTKAIEDMGMNWIHVSDLNAWNSAGAQIYGIRSIPSSLLIGPDGTIVASNLRGEELPAKLAELLDKQE